MLRIFKPAPRQLIVQVARRSVLAGAVALMFATVASAQQGAHEHGVVDLRVAIDGSTLLIEFDSPLDSLVGFEHEPRSDEQRAALASVESGLRDFTAYFQLPAAAGCVLADVQVESPYPQLADAHDDHAHDDHAHDDHDDHKHDDHKHEGHAHADMYAVYQFECAQVAALDQIGLNLTAAFPRITTIRAEIATPSGQRSVRLDQSARSLPL
jgi:hypothetical protein